MTKAKGIGLLSGGLDSALACVVLRDAGADVECLHFFTGFCVTGHNARVGRTDRPVANHALQVAAEIGVPVELAFAAMDATERFRWTAMQTLPHLVAFAVSAFAGGLLVGRFGSGTGPREGAASGLVTALVEGLIADDKPDVVYACGPEAMQRIVAVQAAAAGLPCQVSLERLMACGVGACLSCVVSTTGGLKRACVDGPVFDAGEVLWEASEVPPRH